MTIEQGALVKAWDDDPSEYYIGELLVMDEKTRGIFFVEVGELQVYSFKNAIEIPPDLAKALEELGNE